VKFLPYADHVVVLAEGTITEQGPFASLTNVQKTKPSTSDHTIASHADLPGQENDAPKNKFTPHDIKIERRREDKSRQIGDWEVYRYYFAALSWFVVAMFFVLQVTWAFLSCFPNIWLKWWTDANARLPNGRNRYYIGTYAAFQTAGLVSSGLVTW
jgi:ATP-binding cassette subfamily C (CFTR/MRP) protein 1